MLSASAAPLQSVAANVFIGKQCSVGGSEMVLSVCVEKKIHVSAKGIVKMHLSMCMR